MAERSQYEGLELTVEQLTELSGPLASLVKHPAWAVYIDLLKGRRIQYREILTRGSKDAFDRIVGLVDGLEEAASLPDTILQLAQNVIEREETKRPRHRAPEYQRSDEGGATFG